MLRLIRECFLILTAIKIKWTQQSNHNKIINDIIKLWGIWVRHQPPSSPLQASLQTNWPWPGPRVFCRMCLIVCHWTWALTCSKVCRVAAGDTLWDNPRLVTILTILTMPRTRRTTHVTTRDFQPRARRRKWTHFVQFGFNWCSDCVPW